MEFTLSSYRGPAEVAGIALPAVRLDEHAESESSQGVLRGWAGAAEFAAADVPGFSPNLLLSLDGPVRVVLPDGREGSAFATRVDRINGGLWAVEFTGTGPSPMAA
ncbi:hypothetical protein RM780_03975 [Streptomyces sp. DSM 44917]|uniref:Uncharacterized protein n=1 Tax=Streptomyces boetiae TaxID=3075541 RepID=A0ABU2L3L8_9ACTN|nr:hypothetical protein [Streptomyces sp. DSM 44917]MDT0306120.1 hypothetical protein [Streptomyces sp. DSM 44917]